MPLDMRFAVNNESLQGYIMVPSVMRIRGRCTQSIDACWGGLISDPLCGMIRSVLVCLTVRIGVTGERTVCAPTNTLLRRVVLRLVRRPLGTYRGKHHAVLVVSNVTIDSLRSPQSSLATDCPRMDTSNDELNAS